MEPTQQFFHPSSRLIAMLKRKKSIGASCNTFSMEDSITSISEGMAWAYQVLAYQGAPSIDFSKLRPKGSPLSTGGTASGAVSFMYPYDAISATMRRSEKKNGAGIAYLDWNHPELDDFLNADFQSIYRAVYIPREGTQEADEFLKNEEVINKLAKAYDYFKCFLVKRPRSYRGVPLYCNLCTEVEIPHRGTCVLGAVNLSYYPTFELFIRDFKWDFLDATRKMTEYKVMADYFQKQSPLDTKGFEAREANNQFGLGVFGLASALGHWGIKYSELAEDVSHPFWDVLERAYLEASTFLESEFPVRSAFCIQPTVSTSQRARDAYGFNVSPEVQPVIGAKFHDGVKTVIKSPVKGDNLVNYGPNTETIDDVSYDDYATVSSYFQQVMDIRGLAHRHSHCFYGEKFTSNDLRLLYDYNSERSSILSMYYRLPNKINAESMKKDELWQEVESGELSDFDLSEIIPSGVCQMSGESVCECQN